MNPKRGDRFTYRHYKTWPDDERWELIEGNAWAMSPAPTRGHQEIQAKLIANIRNFLKGKPRKAYDAPFDVLLPRGAPDIAVEIPSPSTSKKDQRRKFDLYQKRGVREYWVVDPAGAWLCVYRLGEDGVYDAGELRESLRDYGPIESRVLPGFVIDPAELFAED